MAIAYRLAENYRHLESRLTWSCGTRQGSPSSLPPNDGSLTLPSRTGRLRQVHVSRVEHHSLGVESNPLLRRIPATNERFCVKPIPLVGDRRRHRVLEGK